MPVKPTGSCFQRRLGRSLCELFVCCISGSQYAAADPQTARFGLMYEWHGSRYLGAAHGLVGICHTLLLCPRTVRMDSLLWRFSHSC